MCGDSVHSRKADGFPQLSEKQTSADLALIAGLNGWCPRRWPLMPGKGGGQIDEQVPCGRLGAVPVAQIILSSLTLIVALITGFLVWKANTGATDQRELQAKREEWWRRFQYAAELALDENNERRANIGVLMVRKMVTSTLAGPDELAAADVILDEVLALGDTDSEDSEDQP